MQTNGWINRLTEMVKRLFALRQVQTMFREHNPNVQLFCTLALPQFVFDDKTEGLVQIYP